MTFTRNEVRGTYLVFQKRRFQCFISEMLRVVGPLGEKFTFLNSLGTTKISRSLRLSVYINVVLLISFPEQFNLNYSSTANIEEGMKFYNLGHKTFETDFSSLRFGLVPWQFQNKMFKPMKVIKVYLSWMSMHYSGLLGGFRLLGDSLGGVAWWRDGS